MKNILAKFSLLFGSVFVAVFIIEIALRILGYGQNVEYLLNKNWGYLMRPSQDVYAYGHQVHFNKLGLRGPEINLNKRDDQLRIIFVGDSVTYGGVRIKEQDLFCRIVESSLNNNEKIDAEIINMSAPGWSPQNWMNYIKVNGLLEADMVIMVLPETDLNRGFASAGFLSEFHNERPLFRVQAILSKMFIILEKKYYRLANIDSKSSKPAWVGSNHLKHNIEAVSQLMNICKNNNIGFLAVFIPSNPPASDSQYWYNFEEIILNPLDIRDVLNDNRYFIDSFHLSVKGHKLVGETIYERLRKNISQLKP